MPATFDRIGLHLDLRVQVIPMPALHRLAADAASLGLDTLLVEWEATFPFRRHVLIPNAFAYTPAEIAGFIRHCAGLGLEVIPLQQCFGHLEYILQHDRYAHLRESQTDLSQLCPCLIDEAAEVFADIFAEVAAAHPAPFLHIGGDETLLLGHCPRCRAKVEKHGRSRLYVDLIGRMARLALDLGKRPVLWADMLLQHPEASRRLPAGCVFIDWNYGWEPNRFGNLDTLRRTGLEFWGAPALRSYPDNHSLTRWPVHFNNLRDFIPFGRRSGYRAQILTSWSTSGLYGYEWNAREEPARILPKRRVYPLSGFRILLHAFARACRSETPIEPAAAVADYARERFGLSAAQGRALWLALSADDTPVTVTGRADPAPVLKSVRLARSRLRKLRPVRHREEFAHFLLMADLREFHLRFKLIETRLNAPGATAATVARERTRLAAMLRETKELDRRFARLNRRFLHPREIAEEAAYRTRKLLQLHDRLSRAGRVAAS